MLGWSFNPIWIFCFHPVFLCKIFSSFLSVPVTFSSFISSLHYLPTVYKYLFSSIFYLTNLFTLVFPPSFGITLPAINISLSIYFYLPIFLPLSFLLFCHCIAFFKYHFSSILYLTNLFTLVSPHSFVITMPATNISLYKNFFLSYLRTFEFPAVSSWHCLFQISLFVYLLPTNLFTLVFLHSIFYLSTYSTLSFPSLSSFSCSSFCTCSCIDFRLASLWNETAFWFHFWSSRKRENESTSTKEMKEEEEIFSTQKEIENSLSLPLPLSRCSQKPLLPMCSSYGGQCDQIGRFIAL